MAINSKSGARRFASYLQDDWEWYSSKGSCCGAVNSKGKAIIASVTSKHSNQARIKAGTARSAEAFDQLVSLILERVPERFVAGTRINEINPRISGTYPHAYLDCTFDGLPFDLSFAWKLSGCRTSSVKLKDGTYATKKRKTPVQSCLGNDLYPQMFKFKEANPDVGLSINEIVDQVQVHILDAVRSPEPTVFDDLGQSFFCFVISSATGLPIRTIPEILSGSGQLRHYDLDQTNLRKMEATGGELLAVIDNLRDLPGATARFNIAMNSQVFDAMIYKDGSIARKISVKCSSGGAAPACSGLIPFALALLEKTPKDRRSPALLHALDFLFEGMVESFDAGMMDWNYPLKETSWTRINRQLDKFSKMRPNSKTAIAFRLFQKAFDGHAEDSNRWKKAKDAKIAKTMMEGMKALGSSRCNGMSEREVLARIQKDNVGFFYYDLGTTFAKEIAELTDINEGLTEIARSDDLAWQSNVSLCSSKDDEYCQTKVASKKFSDSNFILTWMGVASVDHCGEHIGLHWKMA